MADTLFSGGLIVPLASDEELARTQDQSFVIQEELDADALAPVDDGFLNGGLLLPLAEDDTGLIPNALEAAQQTPDQAAADAALAQKTGVPRGVISNDNREQLKQQVIRDTIVDGTLGASILRKQLTQDPDLAILASDDIEALTKVEIAAKQLTFTGAFSGGVDMLQGLGYRFLETVGEATGAEQLEAFAQERAEQFLEGPRGAKQRFAHIETAGDFFRWMKQSVGEQIPLMAPSLATGLAGAGLGAAVSGPAAPVGAIIGGALGIFIPSFILGVGETQQAIKERDVSVEAPGFAFGGGFLIGLMDSALPGKVGSKLVKAMGFDAAEQVLRLSAGRILRNAAVAGTKGLTLEGTTEALQEVVSEVAAATATDTEINARELGEQMLEAFAVGAFMGKNISIAGSVTGDVITARRVRRAADTLNEAFKGSKLRERAPDKAADLVAADLAAAGVEAIFLSPDAVLQWANQHPEGVAVALDKLGVTETLAVALETGTDLEINTVQFSAEVLGTEGYDALSAHLKFEDGGVSQAEAAENILSDEEIVSELQAELENYVAPAPLREKVEALVAKMKPGEMADLIGQAPSDVHTILMDLIQRVEARRGDVSATMRAGRLRKLDEEIATHDRLIIRLEKELETRIEANKQLPKKEQLGTKDIQRNLTQAIAERDIRIEEQSELQAPARRAEIDPESEEFLVPSQDLEIENIENLPERSPGVDAEILEVATKYMEGAGLPVRRQAAYVPVNEKLGKKLARAYAKLKHQPNNPKVQAAYDAFIQETLAQYEALQTLGITIQFIKPGQPNPYDTPTSALNDIRDNRHLWVFPTTEGFGPEIEIDALKFFDDAALEAARALTRGNSRTAIIMMSPEEFLALAEVDHPRDRYVAEKAARAEALLDSGGRFNQLPFLSFDLQKDGTGSVAAHDGRNRMRALQARGVEAVPVQVTSREGGPAQSIRFSTDERRPTVLTPQKRAADPTVQVPFPVIEDASVLDRADPVDEPTLDHPMLAPTGIEIDGVQTVVNDIFRIVHDIFGHAVEGVEFGASGEENAWQSHVRMFSELAGQAMTTESRGQNSWVNYSTEPAVNAEGNPILAVDEEGNPIPGKQLTRGEANRAKPRETVFPEQKAGLLPKWAMTEGLAEDMVTRDTTKAQLSEDQKGKIVALTDEADNNLAGDAADAVTSFVAQPPGAKDTPSGVVFTEQQTQEAGSFPIMLAHAMENIARKPRSIAAKALELAFAPIRKKIRKITGDTVVLYRFQREIKKPEAGVIKVGFPEDGSRRVLSWTADREFAEHHAGVAELKSRSRQLFTEQQIQEAETTFAETGVVKISERVRLEKETLEGPTGESFDVINIVVGAEEIITDTGSVREYMENENVSRQERLDEIATASQKIIRAEIPLDAVLWVTDRAGQLEFIVRNDPSSANFIDQFGKRIPAEPKQTRQERLAGADILVKGGLLAKLNVKTTIEAVRAAREGFRAGIKVGEALVEKKAEINKVISELPIGAKLKARLTKKINSAKTVKQLIRFTSEVQSRAAIMVEDQRRKEIQKAVIDLVKGTKATIKKGGKFNPEVQEIIDMVRRVMMTEGVEVAKLKLETAKAQKDIPDPENLLERRLLALRAGDQDLSNTDAENLLLDLATIVAVGKGAALERLRNKQRERDQTVDEAIHAATQGEPVAELKTDGWWRELKRRNRDLMSSLASMHDGWDEILDKVFNKAGIDAGPLMERLRMTNPVQRAKARLMKWQMEFETMGIEVFGLGGHSAWMDKLHEDQKRIPFKTMENKRGEKITLSYSIMEIRKLWMERQDPTIRDVFQHEKGNAFTDEMLQAMFSHLTEADYTFALAELAFLRKLYPQVNAVYRRVNGFNLPFNEFYSPIQRDKSDAINAGTRDSFGKDFFPDEMKFRRSLPSQLKERTGDVSAIMKRSDVNSIHRYMHDMAHYIETTEQVQFLKRVFSSEPLKAAIKAHHGNSMERFIETFLEDFGTGYAARGIVAEQFLAGINKRYATSVLAIKPTIMTKQLVSWFAMADNIPTAQFLKYHADFLKSPTAAKKIIKVLWEASPMLRARGSSLDFEMAQIGAQDPSVFKWKHTQKMQDMFFWLIKMGDRFPIYAGGWAVYQHTLKTTGSKQKAIEAFEDAVNTTQQSTDIDKMSAFQRHGALGRMLTMFMTSRLALLRGELRAIRQRPKGLGGRGKITYREFGKRMAYYHFAMPMLIQFIASGFRIEPDRQLIAAILGQLNSFVIFGDILMTAATLIFGDDDDRFHARGEEIPLQTVLLEMTLGANDVIESGGDVEDMLDAIKDFSGALGKFVGLPIDQVTNILGGFDDIKEGEAHKGMLRVFGHSENIAQQAQDEAGRFR